jgi:thiol:disulfide interchange protein
MRSLCWRAMFAPLMLLLALALPSEQVRVEARFEPAAAAAGAAIELRISLDIEPGYHVYHPDQDPLNGAPVSVEVPTGFLSAGPLESLNEAVTHRQTIGRDTIEYLWLSGDVELRLPLTLEVGEAAELATTVAVTVQVCNEELCLPPETIQVEVGFRREPGTASEAAREAAPSAEPGGAPGATPAKNSDSEDGAGLLAFLLAAVAGGLFALVMPCTYPMIPITISFFTKQAEVRSGRVLPLSLAYGAGIVAIFVVIGVAVGPVILAFATHPVTNLIIGVAFMVFALALFGVITLNPPQFLMTAAGKASTKGGYVGVFLMGTTLVVTSFTCTAPFVGSLLSFGAAGGGTARVALGMAVFGLTMALPFVVLSLMPGRLQALPQSGQWMGTVKVTLGFVELAAALKFISNADIVWEWGVLSRERFLLLWMVILLAAALYLLGVLRGKGSARPAIGAPRRLVGLAFLVLVAYCGYGWSGRRMDTVMTAIIPNYSSREQLAARHEIVVDDYAVALAQAAGADKLLLVNFTGHT